MNFKPCSCGGVSGPARYQVLAEDLSTFSGVYGNGTTIDEAVANCKREMRQHQQTLTGSNFAIIDLENGAVLANIDKPKRWAEVVR